jgi:hypothetical protein
MVATIWKQSAPLALGSFFFWPIAIYALFHYWGDEESDIKVPFFLFMASAAFTWYEMMKMARSLAEDPEALLSIVQPFA